MLKKPLHTSIAVERDEFESYEVEEENLHIVISVKDFRAIVQHAVSLRGDVSAAYSSPSQPMQLRYDGDEMKCEFVLMTVGERGATGQKAKSRTNARAPRQQLEATASRATSHAPAPAPAPVPQPVSQRAQQAVAQPAPIPSLRPSIVRPSQRPPPVALREESLFVTQEDDQWNPVDENDEDEEDNARLEWNANDVPVKRSFSLVALRYVGSREANITSSSITRP